MRTTSIAMLAIVLSLSALVSSESTTAHAAHAARAHPTPTPTRTTAPTRTATPTGTATAAPTATPTGMVTPTGTATPSVAPSATGSATPLTSATAAPQSTATVAPQPTATASPGYNGAQAAAYADQYWSSYNTQWPSFANSGGDCTNFVSQSLYAGGLAMRTAPLYTGLAAWFMTGGPSTWSYSTSWVNANDNSSFLGGGLHAAKIGTYTGLGPTVTQPSGASQGDVISYDWNGDGVVDHQAIVVSPDGQLVDAHTNSRYHVYWTLAAYNAQWQTTVITVYHITPGTR